VLQVVVVVLEGRAGVVGRIDVDAFDLAGAVGQEGLERLQVVALDEQVVAGCISSSRIPQKNRVKFPISPWGFFDGFFAA
jgi:hypothetical protein